MKKLLVLLLCLIMATCFALTSCGGGGEQTPGGGEQTPGGGEQTPGGGEQTPGEPTHTHSFGAWSISKNPTCTAKGEEKRSCSGCSETETRDIAMIAHRGGLICTTCKTALKYDDLNSIGLKLTNVELQLIDENDLIDSKNTKLNNFEIYVALDDNGALMGYGAGTLVGTFDNIPGVTLTSKVDMFIEDNIAFFRTNGHSGVGTNTTYEENCIYAVDINNVPELKNAKETLVQAEEAFDTYAPIVEEWVNEKLLPIFANVSFGEGAALDAEVTAPAIDLLETFFDVTDNGDGTLTAVIKLDALYAFNEYLASTTIAGIVDDLYSEGTVTAITELLSGDELYALSVADLLTYLDEEQGIDPAALLKAFDDLAVAITGDADATLEADLLPLIASLSGAQLPDGFAVPDLDSFLEDPNLLALSVGDAIHRILARDSDDPETTEIDETSKEYAIQSAKAFVGNINGMINALTVYDLADMVIMTMVNSGDSGVTQTSGATGDEPTVSETYKANIDGILALIDESFSLTLTINENLGAVVAFDLDVLYEISETEGVKVTADLTDAGLVIDVDYSMAPITASYDLICNSQGITESLSFVFDPMINLEYAFTFSADSEIADFEVVVGPVEIGLNVMPTEAGGLKATLDVATPEADFAIAGELIPAHFVLANAAAVSEIKEAVYAAEETITPSVILGYLTYFDGTVLTKILDDKANERFIIVSANDFTDPDDGVISVDFVISVVSYNGAFSGKVEKGCEYYIYVTANFNRLFAQVHVAEIEATAGIAENIASDAALTSALNALTVEEAAALFDGESTTLDSTINIRYLYDTVTKEYLFSWEDPDYTVDNAGHNYELIESSLDDPTCQELCISKYVCEHCNDEYLSYSYGEHEWELDTENTVFDDCTESHLEYYNCKICEATDSWYVSSSSHSYNFTVVEGNDGAYTVNADCLVCNRETVCTISYNVTNTNPDVTVTASSNIVPQIDEAVLLYVEVTGDAYITFEKLGGRESILYTTFIKKADGTVEAVGDVRAIGESIPLNVDFDNTLGESYIYVFYTHDSWITDTNDPQSFTLHISVPQTLKS